MKTEELQHPGFCREHRAGAPKCSTKWLGQRKQSKANYWQLLILCFREKKISKCLILIDFDGFIIIFIFY